MSVIFNISYSNISIYLFRFYSIKSWGEYMHKKAWNFMLSVPRIEALALPIKVEQTTSEPTPIRYISARQYGYSKDTIRPIRVQYILTLTILTVNKPHPGHLPSPQLKTLILNLQDSMRHEQSVISKRLQYVCTLFPPIARFY